MQLKTFSYTDRAGWSVDRLPELDSDRTLVIASRAFGLSVTAEGIEMPLQQSSLQRLGYDRGQGYLFAKPLTADAVAELTAAEMRSPDALAA